MAGLQFPRRPTASAELRNSTLAKPAQRLEVRVAIDGPRAETITLGAGRAQITPDAYLLRLIHAVLDGREA